MTTIHRLHPAPLVCIVCGKPVCLNPDDEWEHVTVGDDLACTVWPVRATEHYREPPGPPARGKCRYCGHRYALTKAGRVRRHYLRGTTSLCGGSGQVPA